MHKRKVINETGTGEVILYKNHIEVRLVKDTVWLTQAQIAELFGTQRPAITKHLSNIFKSKELNRYSVGSIMELTASDGKVYKTQYYNLDAVISVGYRVNSARATQFRIWATNVLKQHLIGGYTLNEKRLEQVRGKYEELKKAVSLIGNVASVEGISREARGIARVIQDYSRALDMLDDIDHGRLRPPRARRKAQFRLTYEETRNIIDLLKNTFSAPSSALVGREKDDSFKSSLQAIYQTFGGKDLYPTVYEKAAHLLYFVAKNHSFVDGNKRIAAALFICFLEKNNILFGRNRTKCMDENALVALTLMTAASRPREKDMVINVILNLMA